MEEVIRVVAVEVLLVMIVRMRFAQLVQRGRVYGRL